MTLSSSGRDESVGGGVVSLGGGDGSVGVGVVSLDGGDSSESDGVVSIDGGAGSVDDGTVSINGGKGLIVGVTVFSLLDMNRLQPDIFIKKMLLITSNEIIINTFFIVITSLHFYHC